MSATIKRHTMPPLQTPGATEFFDRHTYATITLGKITAEVLRLSYWDADRTEGVGVEYEVHINGLPETLIDLTSVCSTAAVLLTEAQRSKG